MKKWTVSREAKIYFMLVITGAFFFVEIVIGYYASSLALIADSFHMLNDLISMCIALWAIKVAKKTQFNPKYSYGWQRAEILGALVNGVFLLALCFTILIDSIERFISPEVVSNPQLVLITGSAGLVANLLGLLLFHEHGHAGHSHGGHGHGHSHANKKSSTRNGSQPYKANDIESVRSSHDGEHEHEVIETAGDGGHLNMKGIFLHVLGDALGNVAVISSALFIWLTDFSWRYYVDPLVSTLITCIIFMSAIPLVKQTSVILLQGVPQSVPLESVHNNLLKLDGIISIHELHVWQLNDTKLIASLHVLLSSRQEYMKLGVRIRALLHTYGIHSVTIQPEFIEDSQSTEVSNDINEKYYSSTDNKTNMLSNTTTAGTEEMDNGLLSSTVIAPENSQIRSTAASIISTNSAAAARNDNSQNRQQQQDSPAVPLDNLLNQNNSSICLLRCTEESCQINACCPSDQATTVQQQQQQQNPQQQ